MGNLEKRKLYDLLDLAHSNVKHLKPMNFTLGGLPGYTDSWAELCRQIVKVLVQLELLTKDKLPIHTHLENEKYFINSSPRHKFVDLKDKFNEVSPGFFVDTKYLSQRNVKNLIYLFQQLGLDPQQLKVAVR